MRRTIPSTLLLVLLCSVAPAAVAQDLYPAWGAVSTETSGTGFVDRQVLRISGPDYEWSGSSSDILFDPAVVLGVDAGLDALHIEHGTGGDYYYFSPEVGFVYQSQVYEDQDLLVYETSTGLVAKAFRPEDILGEDFGLDAACFVEVEGEAFLLFSTEVDGPCVVNDKYVDFTEGDILVTDGVQLVDVIRMDDFFDAPVGLDALHVIAHPTGPEPCLDLYLSTELNGGIAGDAFGEGDMIVLRLLPDPWRLETVAGIASGYGVFGEDVGLDALYLHFVPEPTVVLVIWAGLGALALRLRRRS